MISDLQNTSLLQANAKCSTFVPPGAVEILVRAIKPKTLGGKLNSNFN
jgi:hypothetical protein